MLLIEKALERFSGSSYSGIYKHNGTFCPEPRLTFSIHEFDLVTNGKINGKQGETDLAVSGRLRTNLTITKCGPKHSVTPSCTVSSKIETLTDNSHINGLCWVPVFKVPIPIPFNHEIAPIIKDGPIFPVEMRQTEDLTMQFGSWDGSMWTPDQSPHKKTVNYQARASARVEQLDTLKDTNRGEVASVNISLGQLFYLETSDVTEYRKHYLQLRDFNVNSDIFQIAIDQSFFLKVDEKGNTSGLIGELLPIRLDGKIGGEKINIVLNGGSVSFGQVEGESKIIVGINVESISSGAFIEEAQATLRLSQPAFEKNELVTYIEEFRLKMQTKCFLLKTCIDESLLERFINKRLVITALDEKIELPIPECIESGDRFIPDDKSKCQKGTISRQDNSKKSTRLVPLFDKSRVEMDDYVMFITVAAKGELY